MAKDPYIIVEDDIIWENNMKDPSLNLKNLKRKGK